MTFLLDTHILLWAAARDRMMSDRAEEIIRDEAATLCFSAASIWEIAIKRGLNRPDFRADPAAMRAGLVANGYQELLIDSRHAAAVLALPKLHADPFDRILIAQAQIEGLRLVTVDSKVAAYGDWVEQV